MRVAHLDTGRELRGGQHQVLLLLQELQGRGEHRLLARGELLREALRRGWAAEPLTWWNASRAIDTADLVHAHDARAHTMAALLRSGRLVVSRRVAFPIGRTWISRWKYARASMFIAVSKAVAMELEKAGVGAGRIAVIYDGVSIPDEPSDQSGPVVALRTQDAGKCPELVEAVARRTGILIQASADLPAALRTARVFLYLSVREGLGSAALLASAYGVPVLASDIPGLNEAVVNGVTGTLVPNDVEAIGSALQTMIEDPDQLHATGQKARARVRRDFSAAALADQTWEIYERMCS